MKLHTIELVGFKSFRSKTTVEIGEGITAIVGPNGCGKSNIIDAIRWALGTQSIRSLRGGEMADVIFAGSRQRTRCGFAEVSLSFDKEQDAPPPRPDRLMSPLRALVAASPTLTVTRRMFRAGDNHYLINNNPVRLKDIQEAFLGTGVGVKGYSIIEQGQIEFLIGSRPAERRRFVEELAGVSRYRFNREECERKLAATQQNLDRIQDLVAEVTRQIAALKKQCRVAERHIHLVEQKHRLQVYLLVVQRQAARQQEQALARQLEEVLQKRQEERNNLALCQAEEGQLATAVGDCERSANKLTEDLYRFRTKGTLLRQAVEHASSECGTLGAEGRRLQEDLGELAEEMEQQRQQLEQYLAALEAQPTLDPQEAEEIEGRIVEASAVVASTERQLERCEADLRQAGARLAEQRAILANQSDELARLKAQQACRTEREQQLKLAVDKAAAERDAAIRQHHDLLAQESTLLARHGKASETIQLLRVQLDHLREQRDEIKQQLARSETRRQTKAEAAVREVSEGARRVIQAATQGRLGGVVHLLAEGVIAPPSHERAVHGALRDLLEAVVVRDAHAARQVIQFAEQEGLVVTCIQQDAAEPVAPDPTGSLLDQVELAEWVPARVRALLSATRVVTELPEIRPDGDGWCLVDLKGHRFDLEGIWRSGDPGGGALARRARWMRELAELDRELESIRQRQADVEESMATVREEYQNAIAVERCCLEEIQRHRRALVESEVRQSKQTAQVEALAGQLAELARTFRSEDERHKELDGLLRLSEERIGTAQSLAAQAEQKHGEARAGRERANLELIRHQKALADHQALAQQLEAQRRALAEERDRLRTQLGRNQERHLRLEKRLQEIKQRTEQLGVERQINQAKASQADEQVMALQIDLGRAQDKLSDLRQLLKTRTDAVRAASAVLSDLAGRMEGLTARREQAVEQIERIEANLRHPFGLDPEQAEALVSTIDPPTNPDEQIGRLEEAIGSLGPVNQMAPMELQEAEERHRFLVEQQSDLTRAIEDLRATIDELDRTSRTEFMATFEALRQQFEQLFHRLFQGGEATLALTEGEDPLEAGVEVFVRPPGKRVRCMSLLSGGEKALSAVALVFAAFQLKPSPFCVLDEVDAPLDDVNVERFLDLIGELSANTQFLVITHNRQTMEAADALIGVTMQEPGCSKLVSVTLPGRRDRPTLSRQPEAEDPLQLTG